MQYYDRINIADKAMFRELVTEAMTKSELASADMMSDLTEELVLRYEQKHPDQDAVTQHIRARSKKELYSLSESPEKPTPILDELCDLKLIRQGLVGLQPQVMEEFIQTYGPNAGL